MPPLNFEEVWQLLRQLEDQTIETLDRRNKNKVLHVLDSKVVRQVETADGEGWRDGSDVSKATFRKVWDHLTQYGYYRVEKSFTAACLVSVPELGVEKIKDRPLTIKLEPASQGEPAVDFDEADPEEFGDRERIVLNPEICSGKPTIRGTRIMVSNILGMLAGGYSFDQVHEAYPELSRLDVIAAVEYASWVVDREKVVA